MGTIHGGIITKAGLIYMWGSNRDHQLGIGDTNEDILADEAQLITFNDNSVGKPLYLSCGTYHNLCRDHLGQIFSWGHGLMGVLGHGGDQDEQYPRKLILNNDEKCIYVEAGPYNSAYITRTDNDNNNKVYIWGSNDMGQVGNGTQQPQLIPQLISFNTNIIQLSFGQKHGIALDHLGYVYTWGDNSFGQLGYILDNHNDHANPFYPIPKQVTSIKNIKKVTCGENHNTVLTNDGNLYSWGNGETHQIGIFDNIDQPLPIFIKDLKDIDIIDISIGISISAAISNTGDCYLWGYAIGSPIPKLITSLQSVYIKEIALGNNENCIAYTIPSQDIYTWDIKEHVDDHQQQQQAEEEGEEEQQQTTTSSLKLPYKLDILKGKRISDIQLANDYFIMLDHSGKVLTWGDNKIGQLGLGLSLEYLPIPTSLNLTIKIKQIACGTMHSILLDINGQVYSFGEGTYGKLGHGHDNDINQVTLLDDFNHEIIYINASADNSAFITKKHHLYICGSGQSGFYGKKDDTLPQMIPTRIKNLPTTSIILVSLGEKHLAIIDDEYKCYTWGCNDYGQLGYYIDNDDDYHDFYYQAKEIILLNEDVADYHFIDVQCNASNTLFLTNKGLVYSCGTYETKQLGYESSYDVFIPTQIKSLTNIKSIVLGPYDCAAIDHNNHVYIWGFSFDNILPHSIPLTTDDDQSIDQQYQFISIGYESILFAK